MNYLHIFLIFALVSIKSFGQTCSVSANQTTICSGQSSLLTITHDLPQSSTISWSQTAQTSNTITVSPTSTTSYSCTVTDGSNICVASISIVVNSIPTITSITPDSRCDAGTVNLSSTTSAGDVNWYATPTGGTSLYTGTSYSPTVNSTTSFYVDATNNNCTSNRTEIIATVNQSPVLTNISDQSICAGDNSAAISFSSSISGSTISWNNLNATIGLASSGNDNIASFTTINNTSSIASATISATASVNGCTSPQISFNINVNPKPVIPSQSSTICSGAIFNISPINNGSVVVPSGTTYTWTVIDNPNISGETSNISATSSIFQTLTNNTNSQTIVSYTVTPTSGLSGACVGAPFNTLITVNPKPDIPEQTATICSGANFNISPVNSGSVIVPSGTTYTWSVISNTNILGESNNSSAANSISQTLDNSTNSPTIVSYSVTPTSGSGGACLGAPFNTLITVNPKPVIPNQNATICSGENFNISPVNNGSVIVPSGTTYTWSVLDNTSISGEANNSTAVNSISQTLTNSTNSQTSVSYTITPISGSSGNCVGSNFNVNLTVKPKPTVANQNFSFCSSTTYTSNWAGLIPSNTLYTWSVTNNPQVIGETNNNVALAFSQTLTNLTLQNQNVVYLITPSADACVGSPFTLNLEVKPSPPANAGQDFTKTCLDNINGSSIGGASTPGFNYSWLPSAGLNLSNISNPNANPNITTLYTLTVTDLLSNCSAKDSVLVTVNNTPPSANAGADGNITCVSNPNGITIGTSPIYGCSYSWSPIIGLASFNSSLTIANPSTSQSYTLTVINNTNGCTSTAQVIVTVNKTPPTANAGSDFSKTCISNNNGAQIGTAAVSGNTYSWTPALGLSNSTIANPTANPASSTTYTLLVTNTANGCTSSDQVNVDVNQQQPLVSAGSDFTKTCITNTFGANIGMSPQPNTIYSWTPSTTLTSGILSNPIANPSSTTTYTLTATSLENGCTADDQVVVTVNQNYPAVNAGSDFTKTCVSNTNGNMIGMNAVAGITYSWIPSTGLTSNNIANPIANPSQTTLFTLTSTDVVNGCTSSDQVLVTVNNSAPTAYAGLDATITCSQNINGVVIGMQPENGINYSWSPTNGLSSSNQSQVLAHPNQNLIYTLTATNPINGCVHADVVNITVDTVAPTVNAGADLVVCEGQMVQLSGASNSLNVSWSPSFMVQNANETITTATINGSTTFTLTAIGNNGCVATDAVNAQIAESPISGLLPSYIVCENETINLTVSPQLSCNWSGLYTGTQNDISFIGTSTGNLILVTTNNYGCANSESITITVNPIPYPIISGSQAICQNSYWETYSIPSTSNQINWTVTNGDIMSSSNANDVVIHWGLGTTGTLNVTETITETGCHNDYSYTVLLGENVALDTAEVLQLSSSVLYTPNDYSFMNWGYESILTQIPVSIGVYSQYCEFPNFNPSLNYYWVEIGDGNGCITKSYFNNPNFIANTQILEQNLVEIFPNPTEGEINIKTDLERFDFEIINLDGHLVMSGSGDHSFMLPMIEIPSGLYFITIKSKGYQFNQKIIKL
jgi:hypothetical protein